MSVVHNPFVGIGETCRSYLESQDGGSDARTCTALDPDTSIVEEVEGTSCIARQNRSVVGNWLGRAQTRIAETASGEVAAAAWTCRSR